MPIKDFEEVTYTLRSLEAIPVSICKENDEKIKLVLNKSQIKSSNINDLPSQVVVSKNTLVKLFTLSTHTTTLNVNQNHSYGQNFDSVTQSNNPNAILLGAKFIRINKRLYKFSDFKFISELQNLPQADFIKKIINSLKLKGLNLSYNDEASKIFSLFVKNGYILRTKNLFCGQEIE